MGANGAKRLSSRDSTDGHSDSRTRGKRKALGVRIWNLQVFHLPKLWLVKPGEKEFSRSTSLMATPAGAGVRLSGSTRHAFLNGIYELEPELKMNGCDVVRTRLCLSPSADYSTVFLSKDYSPHPPTPPMKRHQFSKLSGSETSYIYRNDKECWMVAPKKLHMTKNVGCIASIDTGAAGPTKEGMQWESFEPQFSTRLPGHRMQQNPFVADPAITCGPVRGATCNRPRSAGSSPANLRSARFGLPASHSRPLPHLARLAPSTSSDQGAGKGGTFVQGSQS